MKISKLIKLSIYLYPPLLVFLFHVLILGPSNFYTLYNWIDIPMHFIGGMSIALSSILILNECKKEIIIKDKLIYVIIIVSLVALSAIFWEFLEFLQGMDIQLKDTLLDIFMGLLGGSTIALFKNVTTKE